MTISLSPSIPQIKQSVIYTAMMSVLIVGIIGMQSSKLNSLRAVDKTLDPLVLQRESQLRSNKLELMKKAPKFGFNNLVANSTFVDFLSYFGNQDARNVNGYSLGFDYFDVILKQDPKFFLAYFYLSGTASGYMGDPGRSVSMMNESFKSIGLRSPEYSYYLWRLKATDELLFLGNSPAAQSSMKTAANWAQQIGDEEGLRVAAISQRSADFLAKNPASKLARFGAWAGILDTAIDDHARKLAVAKIRELGGTVELDAQGKIIKLTPPAKD
jgi:hypothetical protein